MSVQRSARSSIFKEARGNNSPQSDHWLVAWTVRSAGATILLALALGEHAATTAKTQRSERAARIAISTSCLALNLLNLAPLECRRIIVPEALPHSRLLKALPFTALPFSFPSGLSLSLCFYRTPIARQLL